MSKLIFVNRYAPPDQSATSQLLGDLAFHLSGQQADVSIVASDQLYDDSDARLPTEEMVHGVHIRRIRGTRFGRGGAARAVDYLSFYLGAAAALSELAGPGDVIVAETDPPLLSIAAALVARRRNAFLVNWLQDLFPEIAVALGVPLLRGPANLGLTALRDWSLKAAAANVVLGNGMLCYLAGRGLSQDTLSVVSNWAADDLVVPVAHERNPLRKEWGLEERFVVAYSGNLGRAHETETLLSAAQRLRHETDITFLLVGGGHRMKNLADRVRELELADLFQFRPYQDRAGLSLSLGIGDAHWVSLRPELEGFIVPSKFYGIAAAGRPTIAVTAPDGEIARAVRRYECGLQVTPGDDEAFAKAILALRADPVLRKQLGQNARRAAETHFAKFKALDRWTAILTRLGASVPGAASLQTCATP